jgi:hypothetical protein
MKSSDSSDPPGDQQSRENQFDVQTNSTFVIPIDGAFQALAQREGLAWSMGQPASSKARTGKVAGGLFQQHADAI